MLCSKFIHRFFTFFIFFFIDLYDPRFPAGNLVCSHFVFSPTIGFILFLQLFIKNKKNFSLSNIFKTPNLMPLRHQHTSTLIPPPLAYIHPYSSTTSIHPPLFLHHQHTSTLIPPPLAYIHTYSSTTSIHPYLFLHHQHKSILIPSPLTYVHNYSFATSIIHSYSFATSVHQSLFLRHQRTSTHISPPLYQTIYLFLRHYQTIHPYSSASTIPSSLTTQPLEYIHPYSSASAIPFIFSLRHQLNIQLIPPPQQSSNPHPSAIVNHLPSFLPHKYTIRFHLSVTCKTSTLIPPPLAYHSPIIPSPPANYTTQLPILILRDSPSNLQNTTSCFVYQYIRGSISSPFNTWQQTRNQGFRLYISISIEKKLWGRISGICTDKGNE